jgi:hypothetical protein
MKYQLDLYSGMETMREVNHIYVTRPTKALDTRVWCGQSPCLAVFPMCCHTFLEGQISAVSAIPLEEDN